MAYLFSTKQQSVGFVKDYVEVNQSFSTIPPNGRTLLLSNTSMPVTAQL